MYFLTKSKTCFLRFVSISYRQLTFDLFSIILFYATKVKAGGKGGKKKKRSGLLWKGREIMTINQEIIFVPPLIGGYIENSTGYKYKIIKILNSGTFGTIFMAVDLFENFYAIKVFRPNGRTYQDTKNMWNNEANFLRSLFHPNIAYLHDVFEYKHAFYLVFELLGDPLSNFVKGEPLLSDDIIIQIARQLFLWAFIYSLEEYSSSRSISE